MYITDFVVFMYITDEIIHDLRQHLQMTTHETNTIITINTIVKGPIHSKGPNTF